jgi:FKBP-type peptidyl-prolyl cis-trans isomerase FkpA
MRKISIALMIISLTMLFACGGEKIEFKTHKDGFQYAFIDHTEAGLSPRIGDVVTLKIAIKAPNDSIIKRTNYFRVQIQKSKFKGGIDNALQFMHEGDSMAFLIDALKYYRHYEKGIVPTYLKDGDLLRFDIRMVDVKSMKEIEKERTLKQISGEKMEIVALKKFLQRAAIPDSAELNRVFVKTLRNGNGRIPAMNDNVSVHYFGYFVDGTAFDNSYERGKPFNFKLGSQQVIEGLEQGVMKMKVGEKATIVIPSPLAYGEEGMSRANIPPHTTLVFDVELLDVK